MFVFDGRIKFTKSLNSQRGYFYLRIDENNHHQHAIASARVSTLLQMEIFFYPQSESRIFDFSLHIHQPNRKYSAPYPYTYTQSSRDDTIFTDLLAPDEFIMIVRRNPQVPIVRPTWWVIAFSCINIHPCLPSTRAYRSSQPSFRGLDFNRAFPECKSPEGCRLHGYRNPPPR